MRKNFGSPAMTECLPLKEVHKFGFKREYHREFTLDRRPSPSHVPVYFTPSAMHPATIPVIIGE
jgi:hypothetical protein